LTREIAKTWKSDFGRLGLEIAPIARQTLLSMLPVSRFGESILFRARILHWTAEYRVVWERFNRMEKTPRINDSGGLGATTTPTRRDEPVFMPRNMRSLAHRSFSARSGVTEGERRREGRSLTWPRRLTGPRICGLLACL
jgi:hypothetical protein